MKSTSYLKMLKNRSLKTSVESIANNDIQESLKKIQMLFKKAEKLSKDGYLAKSCKHYQEAISFLEESPGVDSKKELLSKLHTSFGQTLTRCGLGERKQAMEHFKKAIRCDPENMLAKEEHDLLKTDMDFISPDKLIFPDDNESDFSR